MTIPPNPSFSRSGRSVAGGKNIERVSADVPEALLCDLNDAVELIREHTPTATRDMDRTEISGVEEIRLVDPDDYASRHAQLHRQAGAMRDRAAHLELERSVDEACGAKAKKPARVPRDTEPCNLVGFLGIVAGGAAAALVAIALSGWAAGSLIDIGLQWAGVR